jgi:hypothetical protein
MWLRLPDPFSLFKRKGLGLGLRPSGETFKKVFPEPLSKLFGGDYASGGIACGSYAKYVALRRRHSAMPPYILFPLLHPHYELLILTLQCLVL